MTTLDTSTAPQITFTVAPDCSQPPTRTCSLVSLIAVYDRALKAAYEGKRLNGRVLDASRITRAFLLVAMDEAPAKWKQYATSAVHCICKDWARGAMCKHVIGWHLNERATLNV